MNIDKHNEALLHFASHHQGSHKAHQAGNHNMYRRSKVSVQPAYEICEPVRIN